MNGRPARVLISCVRRRCDCFGHAPVISFLEQQLSLAHHPFGASPLLFMVIEHFKHHDAIPVYARFRSRGRLAPPGLTYVNSWVTEDLAHCYQVMECEDRAVLDEWLAAWSDLVDFDVVPVITSAAASARVPELHCEQ